MSADWKAGRGRSTGAGWLVALLVGLSSTALAQPRPLPPAPAPAPAPAKPPAAPAPAPAGRSALARVAESLARDLARSPARALVVSGPLASDAPAPRGLQLVAALAAQVAGRRGAGTRSRAEPAAIAVAREAARSDGTLILLSVEIGGGKLRVSADVYPVPHSVWARIRDPQPGPVAHAYAEAPLDAEVRTYLNPIPLVTATVERGRNFESDVVALACGDLDQDGALEVIAVSRRRVSIVRIRGGKVIPLASRAWPDLAPVAPAPLREPIGFATLIRDARGQTLLDVGLTDRAKSVRLDGELRLVDSFPGLAVPDGDASACTRVGSMVVTGPVGRCGPEGPAPATATIGGQYDAFASASLVGRTGKPFVVWGGRERGALELRDDAGHKVGLESVGAQLAVGDLDQDGEPEIIASLDTLNPLEDAVVVRAWSRTAESAAARLREIERFPAAAGVRALAVCPPDGPGRAPFVVATADELWVVR